MLALACVAGSLAVTLAADEARAGVPRSCIRPQADALNCPRDTRLVTLRVLPAARVRALQKQRRILERVTPRDVGARYRSLEELRARLRCASC